MIPVLLWAALKVYLPCVLLKLKCCLFDYQHENNISPQQIIDNDVSFALLDLSIINTVWLCAASITRYSSVTMVIIFVDNYCQSLVQFSERCNSTIFDWCFCNFNHQRVFIGNIGITMIGNIIGMVRF